MSALSIGQIVAGIKPEKQYRSNQPVWRNSYYEGQLEGRLWRPVGLGKSRGSKRGGRRYAAAVIRAAEALEKRTRTERRKDKPGTRNGVLGDVGVGVLKALYEIVDFASGRLEPAVATLAERSGYCYSAVHDALCRLRRHGFVQWIRRSRATENKGEAGPQVEQIPNAYVLTLPAEFDDLVRRLLDESPVPDDERWRRDQAKQEWQAMLDKLSISEMHHATWDGDRCAGETFARIAALLDARDAKERESSTARETGGSF